MFRPLVRSATSLLLLLALASPALAGDVESRADRARSAPWEALLDWVRGGLTALWDATGPDLDPFGNQIQTGDDTPQDNSADGDTGPGLDPFG
jgi:hypothetical protein